MEKLEQKGRACQAQFRRSRCRIEPEVCRNSARGQARLAERELQDRSGGRSSVLRSAMDGRPGSGGCRETMLQNKASCVLIPEFPPLKPKGRSKPSLSFETSPERLAGRTFSKLGSSACLRQPFAHLAEQDGYSACALPQPSWYRDRRFCRCAETKHGTFKHPAPAAGFTSSLQRPCPSPCLCPCPFRSLRGGVLRPSRCGRDRPIRPRRSWRPSPPIGGSDAGSGRGTCR